MKNYMKVEGFRKVFFFQNVCWKRRLETQDFIAKIRFLNVKIKRFLNVWTKLFSIVCKKRLGIQYLIAKIGFLNVKIKRYSNVNKTFP